MRILSRNGIQISLPILIFIFLSSCASNKTASNMALTQEVKGVDLIRGKIAVFPVFVGEGSRFVPRVGNFSQTAGEEIVAALRNWNPKLQLMNPTQVSSILEENGLSENYFNLEQQFRKTNELDIIIINEFVRLFDIQYFLFSSIDSLIGTESISYKPQVNIEMSAKLYDLKTSQIVRNLSVREEVVVAVVAESLPYENATKTASHSLVNDFIYGKTEAEPKYSFGYLGGMNYANVHTDDSFFDPYTEKAVVLAGLVQRHLRGPFYLQTQVQYLQRKVKSKPFRSSAENMKWSYDFIDIPVLFMFKPKRKVTIISQYVQFGPSICFNWNHSASISLGSGDEFSMKENRIKPVIDFALVFGTGYEFDVKNKLKFYTSLQYFRSIFSMHKYDTYKFRTYKVMFGFLHEL